MVKDSRFWIGMLIGAAAGATTAFLTAPKTGHEMRDDITSGAKDVGRKAGAAWGGVKDKTSDLMGGAKDKAAQVANRGKDLAGSARDRFQGAVSAGKDAAAQKKQEMEAEFKEEKARHMKAA